MTEQTNSGWEDDRLMHAFDMLLAVFDEISRNEGSHVAMNAISTARSHIVFTDEAMKRERGAYDD